MNTTSSNTTFFKPNPTAPTVDKAVDPKRASVRISIEEFEDLISSKQELAELKVELADIKATLQSMLAEVEE